MALKFSVESVLSLRFVFIPAKIYQAKQNRAWSQVMLWHVQTGCIASRKWCPNKDLNDGDWSASMLAGKLDYKSGIAWRSFFSANLKMARMLQNVLLHVFMIHGGWRFASEEDDLTFYSCTDRDCLPAPGARFKGEEFSNEIASSSKVLKFFVCHFLLPLFYFRI